MSLTKETTMPPSTYTDTNEIPTIMKTQPPESDRGASLTGIIADDGEGLNEAEGDGESVGELDNEVDGVIDGVKSEHANAVANKRV